MTLAIAIFFLIIGIILLVKGADLFVDKAELIGKALNVHPILMGMIVVAIGSSLPELVVSVLAAVKGTPLLGAANVIGSNITNIGLIVSVSALIGGGVVLQKKTVREDIPISVLPGIILAGMWLMGIPLTPVVGIIFIAAYIIYLGFTFREYPEKGKSENIKVAKKDIALLIFGLVALLAGGEITLRYAETLFLTFGISETVVGAVLLAFGTSLPELVTTITAILKKDGQMALGGILGSNVFNILGILGISTFIAPVSLSLLQIELWYMIGVSVLFVIISMVGKKLAISKFEGSLLLLAYVSYVVAIITLG